MKRKIKLRDMTKEQWDTNRSSLCKLFSQNSCENCIFQWAVCSDSLLKNAWINNKDLYSDKFLDQEVEIEAPDILDEAEKRYLRAVIRPFRNKIIYIKKVKHDNDKYFISINTSSEITSSGDEKILFPFFQNGMYIGMEDDKEYTLEELNL